MAIRRGRARIGFAAFMLLLLTAPYAAQAQQAKVSVRVAPLGSLATSSLFTVEILESRSRGGVTLPSMTLTNTSDGPQVTNLGLALPVITINRTAVSSRIGDHRLPSTFLASPLSGSSVHAPMRGFSLSTAGSRPWTLSIGQLDVESYTGVPTSDAPSVAALAVTLKPYQRVSVAPRLLVPVRSRDGWQTSIGTAIRADVFPHVALVSDVGAADGAHAGWEPLASAGLVSHWPGIDVETSILRGAPSLGAQDTAIVGSLDRELAQGRVRPLSGFTLSGVVSRSRPASAAGAEDTVLGAVGVVYDRLPYGQLAATRERQVTASRALNTTRVEWRHGALSGFTIRYTEQHDAHLELSGTDHASRRVDLDLPALGPRHADSRLNFRGALTANPDSPGAAISSRVSGRFDLVDDITLVGETELGLAPRDGGQMLRALRLSTDLAVQQNTGLQLLYTYRTGVPFSVGRAFEARISRTIELSR